MMAGCVGCSSSSVDQIEAVTPNVQPNMRLAIQARKNVRWNVEICANERMMRMMKRRGWATVGFSDERTMLTPVKDWRNFDFMNKEKNRRTRD
jgi:hypothetical protein